MHCRCSINSADEMSLLISPVGSLPAPGPQNLPKGRAALHKVRGWGLPKGQPRLQRLAFLQGQGYGGNNYEQQQVLLQPEPESCGRVWGRGTLITDAMLPVQDMIPGVWLAVPCLFLYPSIRASEGAEAEEG